MKTIPAIAIVKLEMILEGVSLDTMMPITNPSNANRTKKERALLDCFLSSITTLFPCTFSSIDTVARLVVLDSVGVAGVGRGELGGFEDEDIISTFLSSFNSINLVIGS